MEKQITSYLISLTHFIHPPGVASTARYCVLIDKMCLIIYCCGMAAHIWWTTRVSSLRFSCSGCARTLCFNWSNKCSIGVFAHCLLQSLLVCFQLRGMMRNPVPTSYHDLHGYEEEELTEWRLFDTSSQLCFLEWLHLEFLCAWKRLRPFCYVYFRHI